MIDSIWADAIVQQCLIRGIDHFFLAPGSRCTPLTLAVARENNASVTQHFDERALAFAALGFGRATGTPGVFICTSGTAVANAFPAVIEAATEAVPLLLLTADRPKELHGTGANQTIDQVNIFGNYPTLFVNLPVPEDGCSVADPQGLNFLSGKFAAAIESATRGPVHVNCMFREPFSVTASSPRKRDLMPDKSQPIAASTVPGNKQIATIHTTGNTLIALGGCRAKEARNAFSLAKKLNSPMLSDIGSGMRTGSLELPSQFDLPAPDTILYIGGRIVSKSWHQWTASLSQQDIQFFHLTSTGKTINPNRLPITRFHVPLHDLEQFVTGPSCDPDFHDAWARARGKRNEIVSQILANANSLSEPAVAYSINASSRQHALSRGLFIGNSTPIRDMDWFGVGTGDPESVCHVAANRGASGIDGLLATASGFAAGLQKPTTVLLGDLSALHDLNSLTLIAKSQWPLVVVILNNKSGHIFDLLPVRQSEHFERFFATPHAFEFEHAARMFGLPHQRITELQQFNRVYDEALSAGRSVVLELLTDRECNLKVRQQIREAIERCRNQF